MNLKELLQPWNEEKLVPNFTDLAYHATVAMSAGQIKTGLDSAAHFRAQYTMPKKDPTPAMRFGSMAHKLILEGPEFLKKHRVMPEFAGKGSKEAKQNWLFDQPKDAIICTEEEIEKLTEMSNSITSHPIAKRLISGMAEQRELSGFFNHDGFRCKMRADIMRPDGIIVDLKTAADASPTGFMKAAWDMRYPIQAYWYLTGAAKLTGVKVSDLSFSYIAVEKEPPYAVAVYTADFGFLEAGERLAKISLDRVRKAILGDLWPSYGDRAMSLGIPKYGLFNLEEMEVQHESE